MTSLMRNNLRPLFDRTNSAHAGLLMQRGLKLWEDGEKPTKKALIHEKIANIKANELYFLAFKRWLNHTHESNNRNFTCLSATLSGRLFTGLPLGGTLETGTTTHHTYGMPMIAGSSIKGSVRNYTEHLFAEKDELGNVKYQNGKVILGDRQAIIDVLFGKDDDISPNAGYLIWHDAWWIPKTTSKFDLSGNNDNKPFLDEIVTVHHQKYYRGELTEALDIENPVPNQQIAVQGSFYFVIEGVREWSQYAKKLLEQTIRQQGLGTKSSAGYGYFIEDKKLTDEITNFYLSLQQNHLTGWQKMNSLIASKSESDLIELLSKNKNITEFFIECEIDETSENRQTMANIFRDNYVHMLENWSNSTNKNTKKAYKFIQKPIKEND